jgi:hypothetical protein
VSTKLFRFWLPVLGGAAVLAVGLALWISLFKTAGKPRVVRFTRLTSDGQAKTGPLESDGVRLYFNEWLPNGCVFHPPPPEDPLAIPRYRSAKT